MQHACARVLMVEPSHFGFNPQAAIDNFFSVQPQSMEAGALERAAWGEWVALADKVEACGIEVLRFSNPETSCPDKVFPNNCFSTHAEENEASRLVIYPMKAPNRRLEQSRELISLLEQSYDTSLDLASDDHIQSGRFLEGTGSLVLDRRRRIAFLAISERSNLDVATEWARLMNYQLITFSTCPQHPIYHTNVMLCLGSSFAIGCLEAIGDLDERRNLAEQLGAHRELITVSREQMEAFCCNCLELSPEPGKSVLMMSSKAYKHFTRQQLARLEKNTSKIVHSPIPTIESVGGGGVRCMLAELF